jgi:hypothetical protein
MDLKFHEQIMNICARDAGITVREMNTGEIESSGYVQSLLHKHICSHDSLVDLVIRLWAGQSRNLRRDKFFVSRSTIHAPSSSTGTGC